MQKSKCSRPCMQGEAKQEAADAKLSCEGEPVKVSGSRRGSDAEGRVPCGRHREIRLLYLSRWGVAGPQITRLEK